MDAEAGQSWTDRYGLEERIRERGPTWTRDIVNWLRSDHKIPRSTAYHQIDRALREKRLRKDTTGRLVTPEYSQTGEQVRRAVVKLLTKYDPRGFFNEAEYHVSKVAFEIGLPPAKIEDDYYRVVNRLRREWETTGRLTGSRG